MSYALDPTGHALQNIVLGETNNLVPKVGGGHLFIVPAFAPFEEKSLVIKFTDDYGTSRTLTPYVDYRPGFQFTEATAKCNLAFYSCIEFLDLSLKGSVVYNYQTLGGSYVLSPPQISTVVLNELRDPLFTSWEMVTDAARIPRVEFPVVDFPWSKLNVNVVKQAAEQLEQAGLVVHLRPEFLSTPQSTVFLPSKSEVGLGYVDNFRTATAEQAVAGESDQLFMTPLKTKQAVSALVNNQLNLIGYKVPVAYKAGLDIVDVKQTYSYQDNVYAARPLAVPFRTTGAFEASKFIILDSNTRDAWSKLTVVVQGTEPLNVTGATVFVTGLTPMSELETRCTINSVIEPVFGIDYHIDSGNLIMEYPLAKNDSVTLYYRPKLSRMPNDRNYYKVFTVSSALSAFSLPDFDYIDPNDVRVTLNDFIILDKGLDYVISNGVLSVNYTLKLGDLLEVENHDSIPFLGKQQLRSLLFQSKNSQ
jgi:hypothetical protein